MPPVEHQPPLGSGRTLLARVADAAVAILLSVLLLRAMYFFNWYIVPKIVVRITGAIYTDAYIGSALQNPSLGPLILDIALSFIADVTLMCFALFYRRPYGTIIAAVLAVLGLAVYFWEVGGFPGMLHSEYGIWYELFSFAEYPVAFYVARYLRGITRGSSDRGAESSVSQGGGR